MEFKLIVGNSSTPIILIYDEKYPIKKAFEEKLFSGEIKDIKTCDIDNLWNATEEELYGSDFEEYHIIYFKKVREFLNWLKEKRTTEEICEMFNSNFNQCFWTNQKQILKPFDEEDYKKYNIIKKK